MAPKRSRKGRKTRKNRKKSRKIKGGQSPSYGFKGDQRLNAIPKYGFVESHRSIASGSFGFSGSPKLNASGTFGFSGSPKSNASSPYDQFASPKSLIIKSNPKSAEEIYDFTNFKDVTGNIITIGKLSSNGFVNQIEYRIGRYRSYAILKSSRTETADNLMYEYNVGQYINSVNKQYPCFLKTYGIFKYKTKKSWKTMQNNNGDLLASDVLPYLEQIYTNDYTTACNEPIYLAILIEYFKDVNTLEMMLSVDNFIQNHLMEILFQIYIPLAQLKNTFTHYDLHLSNVLIYTPVKNNEYIEYHYYMNGPSNEPVSFKSKYMAKIIDYGRSYFDANKYNNSKTIYQEVCKTLACEPDCGKEKGFIKLKERQYYPYIISQKKNESHDLRLLKEMNESPGHKEWKKRKNLPIFYDLLTPELKIMVNEVVYEDRFGTPEIVNNFEYPNTIENVSDAMKTIMGHVTSEKYTKQNVDLYKTDTKVGELHVYMNGTQMMFVKTA